MSLIGATDLAVIILWEIGMKLWKTLVALGVTTMAIAPSNAVVLTSVEVRHLGGGSWIQVAELQAFNGGSVNVALAANGGVASGSSIYSGISTPDKANDGNTGGDYYADNIFHSGGTGAAEFLRVDFAASDVQLLRIFGRTDCCAERDIFSYTLWNDGKVVGTGELDARGNHVAEVRLAPGAVPEPASWAMMIGGFALAGGAMRSRRTMRLRTA